MEDKRRNDCPICGVQMQYAFPFPRPNKAVDSVLWRFQLCTYPALPHQGTGDVIDVITGKRYQVSFKRGGLFPYTIDGEPFRDIDQWVYGLGIVP